MCVLVFVIALFALCCCVLFVVVACCSVFSVCYALRVVWCACVLRLCLFLLINVNGLLFFVL